MIQEQIHGQIVKNCDAVSRWFEEKARGLKFPVYASFDVRDSGEKVAPVDANVFPAGFNNICPTDKESAPIYMKRYLDETYPSQGKHIFLLCEEHTQNAYYWENVSTLRDILISSGRDVVVGLPRVLAEPIRVRTSSGKELEVYSATDKEGQLFVQDKKIDLIICNNDFSDRYESWGQNLQIPMNPPREMGWHRRRKSDFFNQYNLLAHEFSGVAQINPQAVVIETELHKGIDVDDEDSREQLAVHVDKFLSELKKKYKVQGIHTEPFCFIKNNSGTYGLAVVQVHSGQEIRDWNNKTRKKMKAAKAGQVVNEVIIQEGIPTRFRDESGGSAEPCIYMIGGELVGGFLRTHSQKGPEESLNSPGAVYKRLCMSDLEVALPDCPMENVYGWVSKLSALALALEARNVGR